MTISRRRFLAASAGLASVPLLSGRTAAQSGKPIRLIVPFPAGGAPTLRRGWSRTSCAGNCRNR
jgi:tripartite-type tricarboxylate transporter receptor subunit TctC